MKTTLMLTAAIASVIAAPANAANYLQIDFYSKGEGTRTYYESRDGIPYFSFGKIKDMTFTAFIPNEQFFASSASGIAFGQGFTISSDINSVDASGDSSAASGIPDYRAGFDFGFHALFDNAPGGMLPLGFTSASGNAFLAAFTSTPFGYGTQDEYSGSVVGLRVRQVEREQGGVSFVYSVPEPSTWAMMLIGFGMTGAAMRYRRRSTKVAFA